MHREFPDFRDIQARLSPFRRLYIRGEGELSRTMAPITVEHLRKVT